VRAEREKSGFWEEVLVATGGLMRSDPVDELTPEARDGILSNRAKKKGRFIAENTRVPPQLIGKRSVNHKSGKSFRWKAR